MDKYPALEAAISYCRNNRIPIPLDLLADLEAAGIKAVLSLPEILSAYNDRIIRAIVGFFTGGNLVASRNEYKKAAADAIVNAYDTGFADGGGIGAIPPEDLEWLGARQTEEFGYIDGLFVQMKELKKEEDFDYFTWATERADGYKNSIKIIYNEGKIRGAGNKMLTFVGDDGMESCKDCRKYKDQRHRASWWKRHNAIPPNRDFECHGYRCAHYLVDDFGNRFSG